MSDRLSRIFAVGTFDGLNGIMEAWTTERDAIGAAVRMNQNVPALGPFAPGRGRTYIVRSFVLYGSVHELDCEEERMAGYAAECGGASCTALLWAMTGRMEVGE